MNNCIVCNKEIPKKNGKFCSNDCYLKDKRKDMFVICPVCKKTFKRIRKSSICCSYKCSVQIRTGIYKSNKKIYNCNYCGREIKLNNTEYNQYKNHYCSAACYYLSKKINMLGTKNCNYKNAIKKGICPTCKKEFTFYHKKRIFCSYKCMKNINTKFKGNIAEWKAKKVLINEGYTVYISKGSHGAADLIAFNNVETRLIQVKSTRYTNLLWEIIYKKDIDRLKKEITPQNYKKELWIKSRNKWIIYVL
jgi:hypothetical protein